MLDTGAQILDQKAAALKGQRIIILGACCGFGRSMARSLRASGAQVVAIDENASALAQIAGAVPLGLKDPPEQSLRRMGRAWGDARLHGVLNLMPLRHPDKIDLNIAVLQSIVRGFMPALAAHEGQIVTVVARPAQALDVAAGAMAPALLSAQAAFGTALHRDGLSLNLINVGEGAGRAAQRAVSGLLHRALGQVTGTEVRV